MEPEVALIFKQLVTAVVDFRMTFSKELSVLNGNIEQLVSAIRCSHTACFSTDQSGGAVHKKSTRMQSGSANYSQGLAKSQRHFAAENEQDSVPPCETYSPEPDTENENIPENFTSQSLCEIVEVDMDASVPDATELKLPKQENAFITGFANSEDYSDADIREVSDYVGQQEIEAENDQIAAIVVCDNSELNGSINQEHCYSDGVKIEIMDSSSSALKRAKQARRKKALAKKFECSLCGKNFPYLSHLVMHNRTHSGERPFVCSLCGRGFAQQGRLKAHILVHGAEKSFQCTECGAAFTEQRRLKRHMFRHTQKWPLNCQLCGQGVLSSYSLRVHMRTHTGEKPFACEECGASFSMKNALTTHLFTHSGERPFCCERCGAVFREKASLDKHIRNHLGVKPFTCEYCDRGFSSSSDLKKHIKIHT